MNIQSEANSVNSNDYQLTHEEELLIERLIDGELSESERKDLLLKLDERIDGWRYCALSFIEDQALCSALHDNYSTLITSKVSASNKDLRGRKVRWNNCLFSAAAGVLATVVLFGVTNRVAFDNHFCQEDKTDIAVNSTSGKSIPSAERAYPTADVTIVKNGNANELDTIEVRSNDCLLAGSITPQTIVLNNPSLGLTNITTTCTESNVYNPPSIHDMNAIPPEVVKHMYNTGGYVDAHRDEYRFPLDNGRVLILPVDTYKVKNNKDYRIW